MRIPAALRAAPVGDPSDDLAIDHGPITSCRLRGRCFRLLDLRLTGPAVAARLQRGEGRRPDGIAPDRLVVTDWGVLYGNAV